MEIAENKLWSERWRLAALPRDELVRLGLASVLLGLGFVMFHLQGNTTDARMFSRSVFLWLTFRWNQTSGDFSHGWLIPFVSLGILWWKRNTLAETPKRISYAGLATVVFALFLHWAAAKAQHPRASVFAIVMLSFGVPFYLYGWQLAKHLVFPCGYLIFMIPLNFLDTITFPLRMFVTVATAGILNGLGVAVERSGSIIRSVNDTFVFNIDDPCSGLRSLLALTAITAVYAFLTQKTFIRKWVLFLCSIPLAVVGNMARILTIGLMAQAFGQKVATGIYHDYSGYIFFPVAIGLMLALGGLLNTNLKEVSRKWKRLLLPADASGTPHEKRIA